MFRFCLKSGIIAKVGIQGLISKNTIGGRPHLVPKPSESFLYASGEQPTLDVEAPTVVTDFDNPFVVQVSGFQSLWHV